VRYLFVSCGQPVRVRIQRDAESSDASATTRSWLASLEAEAHTAEAHTAANRAGNALAALDRGEAYLDNVGPVRDERPLVSFFDRARLAGERGVTAVQFGRVDEADEALREALHAPDPSAVKIRSRLLTALAIVHVRHGNVDEACALAIESLTIAKQTDTAPTWPVFKHYDGP
jgi:hypothetical protein